MARISGVRDRLGSDGVKEVDVFVSVEAADVRCSSGERTVNLHPTVERVVDDEVVCHTDPVGLHRVTLTIIVVTDCWLVEVCHAPLLSVGTRCE